MGGFVQYFDNRFIEKIEWLGESFKVGTSVIQVNNGKLLEVDDYDFHGTCTIHFRDKPPKKFDTSIIKFDIVYNVSYGNPISNDGNKLFIASSYNKTCGLKQGLHAYDIETGSLLWRVNKAKMRNIFVYDNYLVFLNGYDSVYKVDITSGEIVGGIKNSAADWIFDLGTPYILLVAPVGRLSIIDTETMTVVKKYGAKIVNPLKCLSALIAHVTLEGETLTISGYERSPDSDINPNNGFGWPFERIIDTDFYTF